MRKILFSLFATAALFATDAMKGQTVLFEDSFETYTDFAIANVGNWTLRDVDQFATYGFNGVTFPNTLVPKSFQVFNSTMTTPPLDPTATSNWTARTGQKMMVCFAANEAPWNNDWLISPQVQLTAGVGAKLSFWGKGCDATYGSEKFKVLVSTTGTAVADFTAISPVTITPSDAAWHEYTFSLNAYAGQQVYVAIQCTSDDQFGFAVDDFKIVTSVLPAAVPNCVTLSTPANGATNISYLDPLLIKWTAATGGAEVDFYDLYLGTTPTPTTLVTSTTQTSYTATGLLPSTTYYWTVVPRNSLGSATGCMVYSFTTAANPFAPYCGPLEMSFSIEPITLVKFAGINNTSPAESAGAPAHEDFTAKVGNVNQGSSHLMTLKGNTSGNYTNRFVVFIDWNQNGVLNDAGEVYEITSLLVNSTGTDTKEVTQTLAVPANALLGNTRMRVKKIFGTANYLDPCLGASFGQVEDYTISVGGLAVSDAAKAQLKVYPNPVVDILNIESADKVKSVQVFDLTGKSVSSHLLNSVKNQINLSKLTSGVYVVNIETEKGIQSVKIVKK